MGWLCVVSVMLAGRGMAQFGAPKIDPATVGTVSGHVTFAENRLPARFAEVILVRRPDPEDLMPDFSNGPPKEPEKPAAKPVQKVVMISGRSGFDGSYTIGEVPPGDYYVVAKMQGYVVPIRTAANSKEARDIDKLAADLPRVHVEAARTSMTDVALHRGGVITGKVQFRDGSPVVGMQVRAELVDAPERGLVWSTLPYTPLANAVSNRGNGMDFGMGMLTTDDEGHFRLAGLAPGKYRVSAQLQTTGGMRAVSNGPTGMSSGGNGGQERTLTVFEPGVIHRPEGKVFEIKGDERFGDADIEVDLNGLHTVRGRVLTKEDGHAPSLVGLMLKEDDAKDFMFAIRAVAGPDGSFAIENVAPGTYTLGVMAAEDIEEIPPAKQEEMTKQTESGIGQMIPPKVLKQYRGDEVKVIVGEHDVMVDDILLTEAKADPEDKAGPR